MYKTEYQKGSTLRRSIFAHRNIQNDWRYQFWFFAIICAHRLRLAKR